MHRQSANGIIFYQFEGLNDADLTHAFLTRLGGVSRGPYATLNLGHTVGDDLSAVQENHRRVFALFGVDRRQVVSPYQVHGAHIRLVGREHGGTVQSHTDGLLTTTPGLMLLFRFADCVPLLLWDPAHRAVGLVHIGWRGAANGVIRAAVDAFIRHAGSRPESLWAGIGPAIGPCCYQVGSEVMERVAQALHLRPDLVHRREDGLYLDLPGAVQAELEALGVRQIEASGICTACHTEEWFSYRAENGQTGRFGVLVMLER
ncbi:MAG: peptidoglycan editing factor PgeF [Anaerolineae bacterium]|nr:peptidoglycan editing factor PgeF [Anaerolineae bacterium]MDW8069591.1 peptidoglycan editing factor PgeF [Anaerolineae bacterium]